MASRAWRAWCRRPLSKILDPQFASRPDLPQPLFISPSASLLDAAKQLSAFRHSYLMVKDSESVLGMATERSIVRWLASSTELSPAAAARSVTVGEVMHVNQAMLSVRPSDTVAACLRLMNEKIYRHLPVFDGDTLLGVLKVRDLLEPLKGDADVDAMSDLEAMGATEPPLSVRTVWGDLEAGDVLRAKRAQKGVVQPDDVHEYLRAKAAAHTVGSTATVADAMRQLIRERLTFVVVVDPDDRAVRGVVSERHLLHAFTAAASSGVGGAAADAGREAALAAAMGAAVEGAMTPLHQLLAVGEDDPASKCLALMISSNIRHLPVLKADGRLAGILSLRDMLGPLVPPEGYEDEGYSEVDDIPRWSAVRARARVLFGKTKLPAFLPPLPPILGGGDEARL